MNVYLVDDDSDDHEIFEMALQQTSLKTTFKSFYSGFELLTHLEDNNALKAAGLLIFVDLNMPKMNGIELISNLVNRKYLTKHKVIVYSTTSNKQYEHQALSMGASSYLVKPTNFRKLVEALQQLIPEFSA